MCTGFEIAALVAMAASAAASTAGAMKAADAQADAAVNQAIIANDRQDVVNKENYRLQEEANRIATEESSDRVRKANLELGTIFAAGGEMGIANITPFVTETGYIEGQDLSRIEANRVGEVDRLSASSEAARLGTLAEVTGAFDSAKAAQTGALFAAVGSGLQLTSSAAKMQMRKEQA